MPALTYPTIFASLMAASSISWNIAGSTTLGGGGGGGGGEGDWGVGGGCEGVPCGRRFFDDLLVSSLN